jgi:DNA-binding CsgD family transcriptional regulator
MLARLWQIDASFELGDFARVRNEIEALARCAQQVRGPLARFEVLRCRAMLAQAQGRFNDARRLESDAFAVLATTDHDVRFVVRSAVLPLIGRHIGQDSASLAANSFTGAPESMAETVGLIAHLCAAHTFASAGQLDEAGDLYRSLGRVTDWQPPAHVILFSYAFGVAVAAALGLTDDLARLRELLAPYRGHHVVSGVSAVAYFGPVELWLGIAARHLAMLDDAAADLADAEHACAVSGARGFQVESQLELATVLARRAGPGDLDHARSSLTVARDQAISLGMTPFVTKIADLSSQLQAAVGGNGLTRREREVADLVAQGMTNRDIARTLVLSERTAQSHVQHILTKLGMSNRSQIAVWVTHRRK